MGDTDDETVPPKFRADEEQEYFTELAFQECERWIKVITRERLSYPDDLRKSLEDGVHLSQLLNAIRPGSIKRINKLNTPIAGLDNLSVFIKTCQESFGLTTDQLFVPTDLEDLSVRAIAESNPDYIKQENDRRLTNVVCTVYWLARSIDSDNYNGPKLDYTAFAGIIARNVNDNPTVKHNRSDTHSNYSTMNQHSRQSSSNRSYDNNRYSAAFSDSTDDLRLSSSDVSHDSLPHTRSSSGDSCDYPRTNNHYSRVLPDKQKGAAGDPLQYIKYNRKYSLAETAKEQMEQVAHVKQRASLTNDEEEDVDWKSNLSSWRNRRRKQSAASIAQKEMLDATYGNDEEESQKPTKTFNQIVKDRERRVSSYNSYPIGDEDDIFDSHSQPTTTKKSTSSTSIRHAYDYIENALHEKDLKESDSVFATPTTNDLPKSSKTDSNKKSNADVKDSKTSRFSKYSYPVDDDNDTWVKTEVKTTHREPVVNNKVTNGDKFDNKINNRSSFPNKVSSIKDDFEIAKTKPSKSEENYQRRKSDFSLFERKFGAKEVIKDDKSKIGVKTSQSDTKSGSSKVGNILKSYEKLEPEKNNNIVVKKQDNPRSSFAKSRDFYKSMPESKDLPSNKSKSFDSSDKTRKLYTDYSRKVTPSVASNSVSGLHTDYSRKVAPSVASNSNKDYADKVITIRQGPKREPGFGFTFSGGKDVHEPVVVDHVDTGGSADIYELNVFDEIIAVDRMVCSELPHKHVQDIISKAVDRGQIQLKIRRYFSRGARLSRYNELANDDTTQDSIYENVMVKKEAPSTETSRITPQERTPMMDQLLYGYNKNDVIPSDKNNPHDRERNENGTTNEYLSKYSVNNISANPMENDLNNLSETKLNIYTANISPPEDTIIPPETITSPLYHQTTNPIEEVTEERPTLLKPTKSRDIKTAPLNNVSSDSSSNDVYSPSLNLQPKVSPVYAEPYQSQYEYEPPVSSRFNNTTYAPLRAHQPTSTTPTNDGPPESLLRWQRSQARPSNVKVSTMDHNEEEQLFDHYGVKVTGTNAEDDRKTMDKWLQNAQKQTWNRPDPQDEIDSNSTQNHTSFYIDPVNQPSSTQTLPAYSFNINLTQPTQQTDEKWSDDTYHQNLSEKERQLKEREEEILRQQKQLQEERDRLERERQILRFGVNTQEPSAAPRLRMHEPVQSKSRETITYSTVEPNIHRLDEQILQPQTYLPNNQLNEQILQPQTYLLNNQVNEQISQPQTYLPNNQLNEQISQPQTYISNNQVNEQISQPQTYLPKNQVNAKSHWMLQEAEQRLLDSDNDVGPIRVPPNLSNRWNDERLPLDVRDRAYETELDRSRQFLTQKLSSVNMHGKGAPLRNTSPNSISPAYNKSSSPYQNSSPSSISPPLRQTVPMNQYNASLNHNQNASITQQSYNKAPSPYQNQPINYENNAQSYRNVSPRPTGSLSRPYQDQHDLSNSISGKAKCSGCADQLGFGAAMVIESLDLRFHMQCFVCSLCHIPLGNGGNGADVRVRGWKLHCQDCYTKHEGTYKLQARK